MILRKAVPLALLVSCSGPPPAVTFEPAQRRPEVIVSEVVDGDTIRIGEERVRLIGIDTPELPRPGQPLECLGRSATEFTARELEGRTVRLELDVEPTDRFGRTLAYLWRGKELFNETLVERGLAEERAYPPNTRHQLRLEAAEQRARAAGRGIWGRCM